MTALYILGGIILFFALILSLRAKLLIRIDNGITIRVGIGPVIKTLLPKKEKKRKKPRLSAFTPKNYQKLLEKDRKKTEKKKKKKQKKAAKKQKSKASKIKDKAEGTASKAQKSFADRLTSVIDLVKFILGELGRLTSSVHSEIKEAHITVGTSDAAKTAELYGAISGALSLLIERLSLSTKLRPIKNGAVDVRADFLSEKISAVVDFSLKLSLFSALRAGIHALAQFIAMKVKQSIKK